MQWNFCDEFTTIHKGIVPPAEVIGELDLSEDDIKMMVTASLQSQRTVPAGAAAFWLGVDALHGSNIVLNT